MGRASLAVLAVVAGVADCLPDLPADGPTCGDGVVNLDTEACDPGDAGASSWCSPSCQVVCEGGVVDPATHHCYFWTNPTSTIDLATTTCANGGGHIVHFVDPSELEFAVGAWALDGAAVGGSWVLLQRTATTDGSTVYTVPNPTYLPGWWSTCEGCFAWTDASDIPYPHTGALPPCVNWHPKLTVAWDQASCQYALDDAGEQQVNATLCEREPQGAFSQPCADATGSYVCIDVPATHASKRYELWSSAEFLVAQGGCVARQGQLAHFETATEREQVMTEVWRNTTSDVWIGLSFDPGTNAWRWVDGTVVSAGATPWANLEPATNAAGYAAAMHVLSDPYFPQLAYATDATVTRPYVCEYLR